jgi:hypothetical protein
MGNIKDMKSLPPGGHTLVPLGVGGVLLLPSTPPFFISRRKVGGSCNMAYKLVKASDSFAPRDRTGRAVVIATGCIGERQERDSRGPSQCLADTQVFTGQKKYTRGLFETERIMEKHL